MSNGRLKLQLKSWRQPKSAKWDVFGENKQKAEQKFLLKINKILSGDHWEDFEYSNIFSKFTKSKKELWLI